MTYRSELCCLNCGTIQIKNIKKDEVLKCNNCNGQELIPTSMLVTEDTYNFAVLKVNKNGRSLEFEKDHPLQGKTVAINWFTDSYHIKKIFDDTVILEIPIDLYHSNKFRVWYLDSCFIVNNILLNNKLEKVFIELNGGKIRIQDLLSLQCNLGELVIKNNKYLKLQRRKEK